MRTLVIGDLHHHTETADAIAAAEPHDGIVFLGDYFDDFYDGPEDARRTALWAQAQLGAGATLLFGNHDLPYAFNGGDFPFLACSGYTRDKQAAIDRVLDGAAWSRLKVCARVGPWLLSHAGFHRDLLSAEILQDVAALDQRCANALDAMAQRRPDDLLAAGRDRGGWAEVGGVTWGDWDRFIGTDGIHQIVGHTPSRRHALREWTTPGSQNYCIDFLNGSTYAVVEDTRTTFKRHHPEGPATILQEVEHARLAGPS
ncbi:MAG: metallophosphoesterase [Verrucomicrobia bacterium]|nr:metallophosphoesterase [Verrucomicrobiota bacterium]